MRTLIRVKTYGSTTRHTPRIIRIHHRVIVAVGKHVAAHKTLARAGIPVRVDKPPRLRVVIPRVQVVETRVGA